MPLKSSFTISAFRFRVTISTGPESGTATVTWHPGQPFFIFSEITLDSRNGPSVLHPRLLDHAVIATAIQAQCGQEIADRLFGVREKAA